MRSFVSKQLYLRPHLKPKISTTFLRHLSVEPNHQSPPPFDDSPVVTQVISLLQNEYTNNNSQLLQLLPSLSSTSFLKITRQLGTMDGAFKFFSFLRTHSPDPRLLSFTFQAIFELVSQGRFTSLKTEKIEFKQSYVVSKLSELFVMCKELNVPLTIDSAILLVGFFGRARMVDDSVNVYSYLDVGLRNTKLMNAVVDILLRSRRVDDALKVFDEMLEPNTIFPPDQESVNIVFGELLRRDSRGRSVSEERIAGLVSKCGKHGVSPKGEWLSKIIAALCRKGNTDMAWDILHEIMGLRVVDVGSCNALLTRLAKAIDFKRMNTLLQDMKDNHIQPNAVTFGILIQHLCKCRRVDKALDVFKKMSDGSDGILVKPDTILYNTLINGLCKVGRQEEALDIMEQMKLQPESKPNTRTFNTLIDGFCKSGEVEKANELFKQMNNEGMLPDVITVNALVDGFCKQARVNTAIKFFRKMQEKGVKGNVVTYTNLINAFCNSNNIDKAVSLFDEMLDTGCSPDAVVYYAMISGLTNAGRLDDASFVVSKMKEAGFHLDTVCYNILIGGFCRRKKLDKVYDLLKDMEENNVKPDTVTYNTLLSFFSESGDFKTAHRVMRQMVREGLMPTVVTYGSLIHAYCLAGNLDEAMRLFRDMDSASKIRPNNVIYNIMINSLCKNNKVEDALSLMDDMKVKGVRPNTNTFNAMFKGLYEKNWLDKALKLMDQMTQQACNPDYITMEILTDWLSSVNETTKLENFVKGYKVSASSCSGGEVTPESWKQYEPVRDATNEAL